MDWNFVSVVISLFAVVISAISLIHSVRLAQPFQRPLFVLKSAPPTEAVAYLPPYADGSRSAKLCVEAQNVGQRPACQVVRWSFVAHMSDGKVVSVEGIEVTPSSIPFKIAPDSSVRLCDIVDERAGQYPDYALYYLLLRYRDAFNPRRKFEEEAWFQWTGEEFLGYGNADDERLLAPHIAELKRKITEA